MAISTVLFVIMVIILFTTAITLFYLRDKSANEGFASLNQGEVLNYKALILDYYLENTCKKTAEAKPSTAQEAIDLFKKNLALYKDGKEYVMQELLSAEGSANDKTISLENGKVKCLFSFDLVISSGAGSGSSQVHHNFEYTS